MGRDQKTAITTSTSFRENVPPWIVPHTDSSVAAIHGVEFCNYYVCLFNHIIQQKNTQEPLTYRHVMLIIEFKK
jgi:hypothetical protein